MKQTSFLIKKTYSSWFLLTAVYLFFTFVCFAFVFCCWQTGLASKIPALKYFDLIFLFFGFIFLFKVAENETSEIIITENSFIKKRLFKKEKINLIKLKGISLQTNLSLVGARNRYKGYVLKLLFKNGKIKKITLPNFSSKNVKKIQKDLEKTISLS
jgi:hypothetical protein